MSAKFFNRKRKDEDEQYEYDYDEEQYSEEEYDEDEQYDDEDERRADEVELEYDEYINSLSEEERSERLDRIQAVEEGDAEEYYEDYDEYDEDEYEQYIKERKKKFVKVAIGTIIVLAIAWLVLSKLEIPILKGDTFLDNEELKASRTMEVIEMMYEVDGVEDITNGNGNLLTYFSNTLHHLLDVSDPMVFSTRYSEFSNEATNVDIVTIEHAGESTVYAQYIVSSDFDLPSKRLAKFIYNEDGLIIGFEEYRVYPIMGE